MNNTRKKLFLIPMFLGLFGILKSEILEQKIGELKECVVSINKSLSAVRKRLAELKNKLQSQKSGSDTISEEPFPEGLKEVFENLFGSVESNPK